MAPKLRRFYTAFWSADDYLLTFGIVYACLYVWSRLNFRGGHSIFFSLFAIDGSITFSLLIDFDKSTFLGIFMFASSINRCFRQVTKNPFLLSEEVIYESQTDSSGAWGGEGGGGRGV